MEIITSKNNALIKKLNALKERKYRENYGEFVAEGYRNVHDSIDGGAIIISLVFSQSGYVKFAADFKSDGQTFVISDNLFDSVCGTDNAQGVLCVIKIEEKSVAFLNKYVIYLDRIRDPGNLGTIIRTAVAAGFDIVLDNCVDIYNPKVVRGGMSAIISASVYDAKIMSISALKLSGYKIIAAAASGNDINYLKIDGEKLCLIIGNEADGISEAIMSEADIAARIPMDKIESLNAGVSAGILMYYLKYFN